MKLDKEIVKVKKWMCCVPPDTGWYVLGAPNRGENQREDVEGQRDSFAD